MEDKIKDILKEHENHNPIYTCRLQISGAITALFNQEKKELLELLKKNKYSEGDDDKTYYHNLGIDKAIKVIEQREKLRRIGGEK